MTMYDPDNEQHLDYGHQHKATLARALTKECKHTSTENSVYDRSAVYCMDCGMRMITPPGPVHAAALADARTLSWHQCHTLPPMPVGKPFYAAWRSIGGWSVVRIPANGPVPHEATHWHEDTLGLPFTG